MNIIDFLTQPYGKLVMLDVLIIVAYMLLCLYIGFRKSGTIRNIKDFALGRANISTAMLVATIYATHLGAGATFGTIEKVYSVGAIFALGLLSSPLRWLCSIWLVNNNIERFQGCLSLGHIMKRLYGPAGLWSTNVVSIFGTIATISAQASAIGYLLHYFLFLPVHFGIILGISIVTLYSTLGGIRAVVVTDMLQFILFYLAIPIFCALSLYKIGGYTIFIDSLPQTKLDMSFNYDNMTLIFGLFVFTIMDIGGTPFIQRFLMSGDSKQLVKALKAVMYTDLFMTLVIIILGFTMMPLLPETISPRVAFLELIYEFSPLGILGIIVVGLIAVIMSTADSFLNTVSILCAHDIGRLLFPKMSDRTELLLAKLSTVLISIAAVTLALCGNSVMELIWMSSNIYNPVIFVPMTAGFFGFSTNSKSFITSAICAITFTILGAYIQEMFDLVSLMFGLTGSAIGLFGMHYFQIYTGLLERREEPRLKKSQFAFTAYFTKKLNSLQRTLNIKNIINKANRNIVQDPPNYYTFAALGIVYCLYPLLLLVAAGGINASHSFSLEIMFRIIGVLGCVGLLFYEMWDDNLREKCLGIYWFSLLLWCLPMLGAYGLMLRYDNWIWAIQFLLALFMLAAFANYRTSTIIMLLGISLGFGLAMLSYKMQLIPMPQPVVHTQLNDTTAILIFLFMTIGTSKELISKIKNKDDLSTIDELTSLYNKRYLSDNLDSIIEDAHADGSPLSMLMLDMDHFGQVNKLYGHQSGDAVLKELGRRIKQTARSKSICARYGGEEFMIIMPGIDLEEATKIAERLLAAVASTPFTISVEPPINCTTSIGVAGLKSREKASALVKRADSALKLSKINGRNRVTACELGLEKLEGAHEGEAQSNT